MYTETGRIQPVTETPLSLCDSMQLILLQSWGDKIRVFPAVPKDWENIEFGIWRGPPAYFYPKFCKSGAESF